jgi:competence protein ComEC
VTLALRPEALADDCARAVLVVTASQAPPTCAAPVITLDRLRRQGVLALRRSGNGFVVEAVKPKGFDRPWSPALAGDAEAEPNLVRAPAAPRAVDATPAEADQQVED